MEKAYIPVGSIIRIHHGHDNLVEVGVVTNSTSEIVLYAYMMCGREKGDFLSCSAGGGAELKKVTVLWSPK